VPGLAAKWEAIARRQGLHLPAPKRGEVSTTGRPSTPKWPSGTWSGGRRRVRSTPTREYFRGIAKIEHPRRPDARAHAPRADALFVAHMAEGDSVMLPMKGYEDAKSSPIGTGPFKFAEWVREIGS